MGLSLFQMADETDILHLKLLISLIAVTAFCLYTNLTIAKYFIIIITGKCPKWTYENLWDTEYATVLWKTGKDVEWSSCGPY
jgi:hypothetical protein